MFPWHTWMMAPPCTPFSMYSLSTNPYCRLASGLIGRNMNLNSAQERNGSEWLFRTKA